MFFAIVSSIVPDPVGTGPVTGGAETVTHCHPVWISGHHGQPVPVVTRRLFVPPCELTFPDTGDIAYVHPAAVCVTFTVWPATVNVVDRIAPALELYHIVTIPGPFG